MRRFVRVPTAGDVSASLKDLELGSDDIPTSILLGAGYDGERRVAFLEFYDPTSQRIFHHYDKSGHLPYCFTKETLEELAFLRQRKDVVDIHAEEKMDLINDKRILVSKIVTSDPLAIGGATNERSIRNTISAYEADIKYYENYLYDKQLQVGSFYSVREGKVIPEVMETADGVEDALHKSLEGSTPPLSEYIRNWALLLTQPQPEIKRAAIDIEVYSPVESRIPDPEKAEYQIISVALAGSDGKKVVYVLERPGLEPGPDRVPPDVEKRFFKTEPELLLSVYYDLLAYPVVITFNGDDFDLPYLYQRSLNMNIPKESIPISRGVQVASIRHGIHIDLYKAFNNRSIQIYAFSNKYSEHTLNGVASGLLGREKVEIDVPIGELPLNELAYYNYVDSELTLDLTRFNNDVFMKLFITICRISKMPLEDASRLNVSNWIRSLMIFEHRRWNALVPRREDLEGKGGASSEAIIKGKKYKGGFVVDPKPGVHFNVVVLDFASLYPSLIKVYNLSYETVRCVHPECRSNLIPETDHWVCTKRKGMTSLLIGSLRDVRVGYFKSLAKRPGLTKADKEFYNVISQALKVFLNACFTGDTDIVTPEGIRNIKEMKVGDRVVNVNPDTLQAEIDSIVEVQQFPYKGQLFHFRDKRFVDLMVTPNHRFLTIRGKGRKAIFRSAEEVFAASDISIPRIVPATFEHQAPLDSSLLGAEDLGAKAAFRGGGTAGHSTYTTASKEIAEGLVVRASLLGERSRIGHRGKEYSVVCKDVSSQLTHAGAEKHKHVSKVSFDGTVYCVTTEKNHTVFAGRNGAFAPVGQSYGVMGYDNFALYCLPVAEATAALGRYSIGKTIEKAKDLGVEVLYGDSVAGDSVVWVKEEAGVHATRIENLFDWPSGTTVDGKEYFVPRDLSVLTLDDAGKSVFRPVKYVMRHLTKKKLYRVSLTNRLALTVTEDHSLMGLRPGRGKSPRFVEVKPQDLKKGAKELIALARVPLDKVAVRGYPKEVYEFLGSFVTSGRFQWTEGCVGSKLDGYALPAGPDAKYLLSLLAKLKEGGWVGDYGLQGSPGEIAISGGKLSILLIELAEASGQTQVPFFVFNESEENVASFVRGTFGLEGSLKLKEGGRAASLSNPRACIPDGIRELLWRLGMPSSTYYTVSVKKDGSSGSPMFWLELDDAQAVFRKVGFLSPEARRRLHRAPARGPHAEPAADFVRAGVANVTEVKGDNYVYDLEVDGNHRFFANGILCHNTDSVFLRAPSTEQLDLILAWARKELGIDLEVDKVYRYAAFSNRKKNYAAVYPDGTLEVKGLTGKKSNIPLFIKKTFKDVLKVLSEVKNPDEFTAARENIRAMLRETYLRLKRREIPMEDLAFHVMMSKAVDRYTENTPQHVKAAQLLASRGREMKPGDVISFVKTTSGVGVKPVELAKPEDIDVDKYVEYMRGTFDQLLDSIGYDFDEILGATKLEDFFGF